LKNGWHGQKRSVAMFNQPEPLGTDNFISKLKKAVGRPKKEGNK
jgi:hypothetical protein